MDIQMPVMDGLEATRQIRTSENANGRKRIPIVALTASAMHEQREACFAADMDGVVTKPISKKSLEKGINEVTRR